MDLKQKIRDIPDFPKRGIIFKDITTLLDDAAAFKQSVDDLAAHYADKNIDVVACVEARGFIFGAPIAYKLGAGLAVIRKPGKLPYKTHAMSYDLEYGTDTLHIHQDAITPGQRVLIIDDLLATGGTIGAVIQMIEQLKGNIIGIGFLIELGFLNGRDKLAGHEIFSLINY